MGQAQFDILAIKGLDSECWRSAVASIEADCQTMSHSRKQRLAVQLNNCHLKVNNRRIPLLFAPGFAFLLTCLHEQRKKQNSRNQNQN